MFSAGYSVYWASPEDFTNDRFRIEEIVVAFDKRADSAFAASWADPPEVDPPEEYLERFMNGDSLTFRTRISNVTIPGNTEGVTSTTGIFVNTVGLSAGKRELLMPTSMMSRPSRRAPILLTELLKQRLNNEKRRRKKRTINTSGNREERTAIGAGVGPVSKSTTERRSSQMIRSRTSLR